MSDRIAIGLDNSAFRGRLRQERPSYAVPRRSFQSQQQSDAEPMISDVQTSALVQPVASPLPPVSTVAQLEPVQEVAPQVGMDIVSAEPFAQPAEQRQQPSRVLMRGAQPPPQPKPRQDETDALLSQLPMRQEVTQPEPEQPPEQHLKSVAEYGTVRPAGFMPKIVFGVACLVFLFGVGVSIRTQQTNQSAAAQFAALTKEMKDQSAQARVSAATKPAEDEEDALQSTTIAPDDPSTIQIPKINLDAKVQAVGLTDQGKLQLPSGLRDVGWYSASSKPGQPGAVVVHGQMSTGTAYGAFQRASELVAGDSITVVRGNHSSVVYKVVSIQTLQPGQDPLPIAKVPQAAGKNALNIIAATPDSTKPIIVFTEQQVN